jgi:hypothetical protein
MTRNEYTTDVCYGHIGLSVVVVCVLRVLSAFALIGLDPHVPGWGCARVRGVSP